MFKSLKGMTRFYDIGYVSSLPYGVRQRQGAYHRTIERLLNGSDL